MTALNAILLALLQRERTGQGSSIQVSLFDSIADWMNVPLLQFDYSGYHTARTGVNHPSLAPYGSYCCADGKEIIISVQNDREWVNFCNKFLKLPELIRRPGFADNMQRLNNRAQLDEIVGARIAQIPSGEAMEKLEAAELAYGRLNQIEDVAKHPHLRRLPISTPEGEIKVIAPAAIFDGEEAPAMHAVPARGAHSTSLREEFADSSKEHATSTQTSQLLR